MQTRFVLLFLATVLTASAQTLRVDSSFTPNLQTADGTPAQVNALAVQADGRLLVGGNFTTVNGQTRPGLARLMPDGTLDPSFAPPASFRDGTLGGDVTAIMPSRMGGIYVELVRNVAMPELTAPSYFALLRLTETGAVDSGFTPVKDGANFEGPWTEEPGGSVLVVARNWANMTPDTPTLLRRHRRNGTFAEQLPVEFAPANRVYVAIYPPPWTPPAIFSLRANVDGSIVAAGDFTAVNRQVRPGLARLTAAGIVDASFPACDQTGWSGDASAKLLDDGRAVLAIDRQSTGLTESVAYLVSSDGRTATLTSLTFGFSTSFPAASAADGTVLFAFPPTSGLPPYTRLQRLRSDGNLDLAVNLTFGPVNDPATITAIATTADGGALVRGHFYGPARGFLQRLVPAEVAAFTAQPQNVSVLSGQPAVLRIGFGAGSPTYQWFHDGVAVAGATNPEILWERVQTSDAGSYYCGVTISGRQLQSDTAVLTVGTNTARLSNLSARARSGGGAQMLIGGLVLGGTQPRPLLIRGIGRTLANFGVSGTLSFPLLTGYSGQVDFARDRGGATAPAIVGLARRLGAFPLPVSDVPGALNWDAALAPTVAPGLYTFMLGDVDAAPGVGLLEIYDAGDDSSALLNLSARASTAPGSDTLIVGFVVAGKGPARLLLRGVGMALTAYGVTTALSDPRITLFQGSTAIAANDDWSSDAGRIAEIEAAAQKVGAFALPRGGKDAALLLSLYPGAYTVHVAGPDGASGVALAEVYLVRN